MGHEAVNHPAHYTFGKYEVIDVLQDWFNTEPLLWQVVKYCARCGKKGDAIEDLKKAEFYLKRKINELENEKEKKNEEISKFPGKWNLNYPAGHARLYVSKL